MHQLSKLMTFHYARNTICENQRRLFRLRHVDVLGCRDLLTEPLTPDDFWRRPHARRGRYLLKCRDRESGQLRQFYVNNTQEFWAESELRIGLYSPYGSRPERILSDGFGETFYDRAVLAKALVDLMKQDFGVLQLRVFCDDLRVVA